MPKPEFPKEKITRYLEKRVSSLAEWSISAGSSRRLYARANNNEPWKKRGQFVPIGWSVTYKTWGVSGVWKTMFIADDQL